MERKECPYNRGMEYIRTISVRGQENCPRLACSERGERYACYFENCRVQKEEEAD